MMKMDVSTFEVKATRGRLGYYNVTLRDADDTSEDPFVQTFAIHSDMWCGRDAAPFFETYQVLKALRDFQDTGDHHFPDFHRLCNSFRPEVRMALFAIDPAYVYLAVLDKAIDVKTFVLECEGLAAIVRAGASVISASPAMAEIERLVEFVLYGEVR